MSWAATASAVAGVAGGLISNSMNNSKGGQEGQTVYNFNDPQDLAMRQQSQAFMSNALAGLQNGQSPSWLNNTLNPMQSYLMQQNQNQMFGLPGQSGGSIADVAQSQGAAMGLGGQAAMAPMNDALAQYGQRMNGINQYINSLKMNADQQMAQSYPSQLYNTAQPRNQIAYNNIPGTPNTAPQLNLSGFGGNGGVLTQGLQSLFAPQQQNAGQFTMAPQLIPGVNYVPQQQSTVPTSSNPSVGVSSYYSNQ